MQICLPALVRQGSESSEKGSVSEIELFKFLRRIGYSSFRFRHRIRGTTDQWSKGFQRWKNLRWIQMENSLEMRRFKEKISTMTFFQRINIELFAERAMHFLLSLKQGGATQQDGTSNKGGMGKYEPRHPGSSSGYSSGSHEDYSDLDQHPSGASGLHRSLNRNVPHPLRTPHRSQ